MFLNCSYFYNYWEAFFAFSSVNCCKVWLSWPLTLSVCCQSACFVIISQSYGYFIKFSYLAKNGKLRFVLRLFFSFGKIWSSCSCKIVLIKKSVSAQWRHKNEDGGHHGFSKSEWRQQVGLLTMWRHFRLNVLPRPGSFRWPFPAQSR